MSLTLYQSPQPISPVWDINPMTIYSTSSGLTDYYYVYFITDEDGVVTAMKQAPSIDGLGIFNPNVIAKSMIETEFEHTTTGVTTSNNVYQYKITYGGLSDTSVVDALVTTDVVTIINAASTQIEYSINMNDYCLSATTSKFLSDYNDKFIDLQLDDYYVLSFLNGSFSGTTYNSNVKYIVLTFGTDQFAIENPYCGINISDTIFYANPEKIILNAGVGPKNLLNNGNLKTYPALATYFMLESYLTTNPEYSIRAVDNSGNTISQSVNVSIGCKRGYNKYQIFYMNNMGAFDSVSFNNGNWQDFANKTSTYRKDNYSVVNNQYVYTNGNRGLTTLNKTSEKTLTVNTSYDLYEDVVEKLILSSNHYLVDGATKIPLVLDTEKFRKYDMYSSRLNSYPLVFNYANKININV